MSACELLLKSLGDEIQFVLVLFKLDKLWE